MVDASSQLVWQLVKNHNSFLRKNQNNTWFSAEPGNLLAKHSYKYSGIVNEKAVSVRAGAGEGSGVVLTKKNKKGTFNEWQYKKKNPQQVANAIAGEVKSYRPDLEERAKVVACVAHGATRRPAAIEGDTAGGRGGGGAGGVGADDDDDSDDDMPELK